MKKSNNILNKVWTYLSSYSFICNQRYSLDKDNSYILITKSDKAKQVCRLAPLADLYLVNYFFTYNHHVCFITSLKLINK